MFTRKFFRQFCSKASTNISWVYEPTLSKYQYFSSISFFISITCCSCRQVLWAVNT
jgi:hypothetical protein